MSTAGPVQAHSRMVWWGPHLDCGSGLEEHDDGAEHTRADQLARKHAHSSGGQQRLMGQQCLDQRLRVRAQHLRRMGKSRKGLLSAAQPNAASGLGLLHIWQMYALRI
jgi:hypothetical protein